jgi:hypothetical protein
MSQLVTTRMQALVEQWQATAVLQHLLLGVNAHINYDLVLP